MMNQIPTVADIGNQLKDGLISIGLTPPRINYINSVAQQLLGIRTGASLNDILSLSSYVGMGDREFIVERFSNLLTTETPFEVELDFDQGAEKRLCCAAFLTDDKRAIVVLLKDITTAKQVENYLVEYGAKKNNMLESVIHHFSDALKLMQHISEDAEKSTNDDNLHLKKLLNMLKANAVKSLTVAEDLVKEEHDQAPNIAAKRDRFELVSTTRTLHENLVRAFKDRKFKLVVSDPVIYGYGDEFKFLQIVNNLLSNAIKFTHQGQEIRIRIKKRVSDILITISDPGIGIPLDLQPYIFERHSIAGRNGLNGEKSLGLGLSICKRLVEMMLGEIWFDTREGHGSNFYFTLPIAPQ